MDGAVMATTKEREREGVARNAERGLGEEYKGEKRRENACKKGVVAKRGAGDEATLAFAGGDDSPKVLQARVVWAVYTARFW